ncbi:bifunctional oligoribonuclease/PAP phosphatase NrnA [Candidatus Latescibacterota bacterium]
MQYFPENTNKWKEIASVINRSKTIYLSSHVNPDGDALGSEIAFRKFLRNIHKKCRIINYSKTPELYKFLDPNNIIESYYEKSKIKNPPGKNDSVIFLDMGNYKRAGKVANFLLHNNSVKIVIDHHQPDMINADILVVNPKAAATGSLLYDLFCTIDKSAVDKKVATALLTAVITDTGYFKYRNTTSTTHLIASALYSHGVSTSFISKKLEIGFPLPRQILIGLALSNIRTTECGRISYSFITQDMFEKAGAKREYTENIIQQIIRIKGTKIAILIIQEVLPDENNNYKISFRSVGNIPVNTIASKLKGGGHKNAAGANMIGSLETIISKVTNAAAKLLNDMEESCGKDEMA